MSAPQLIRITRQQYNDEMSGKVGSLLFPNQLYDTTHYVDTAKLRQQLKTLGWELPKGKKISVLLHTDTHPNYKNKQNTAITYKEPLCASYKQDGAYYGSWGCMSNHPVSDVYIVV
jgi:hypothetical protein